MLEENAPSDVALRDIPVVMISALEDINSVVRCIELGATDYLTKPFNPVLLKARVDNCIEKSRYRAQEAAYLDRIESERRRADELLANRPAAADRPRAEARRPAHAATLR